MSELGNKLAAFSAFHRGLRIGSGDTPLARFLDRAEPGDAFTRLWMLEGYGYGRTERALRRDESVPWAGDARWRPDGVRIPLHTGAGLALASRRLRDPGLRARCSRSAESLVARFREDCRWASAEGWQGVAFEGLGLAVRSLRPELTGAVDRRLADDPELRALFWHGVGRALYFVPSHAWRPDGWSAWREAARPDGPTARTNRLAGLAWALTLVNIRQPEIVRGRWRGEGGDRAGPSAADEPFGQGMAAALRLWFERHGRDETLARFLGEDLREGAETDDGWRQAAGRLLDDPRPLDGARAEELFRCPAVGSASSASRVGLFETMDGLIGRGVEWMAAASRGELDPRAPLVWGLDAMALSTLGLSEPWAAPLRRALGAPPVGCGCSARREGRE